MISNAIERQRKGRAVRERLGGAIKTVILTALCVATPGLLKAQLPDHNKDQQQKQQQDQGEQGQSQGQSQPPQSGAPPSSDKSKKDSHAKTPTADEDPHKYDAYNAEKDIEVGTFYLHKGDLDAAIPRFEEAASLRPTYGKPRLLLAEAYEKKKEPETALKYYKEYLKVYPDAPDAKKIQRRIEKLEGK